MTKKKTFYVRILRCSRMSYWYRPYVGLIFPVHYDNHWIMHPGRHYMVVDDGGWIERKDAEQVEIQVSNVKA